MPANRTFRAVRGRSGLDNIRPEWDALVENILQPRFFHLHAWYEAYMEHLEVDPDRAVFVLVHQGIEIEAIFPLLETEKRYLGIAIPVLRTSCHPHFNLHDVLLNARLDHRSLISDLLEHVNSHREYRCALLRFDKVLENSAIMDLIGAEKSLGTTVIEAGNCNYLTVRSKTDLLAGLSRNFRRNLKRARKKLAKHTVVDFLSTRDPGKLREYYQQFLEVEASGWKGATGTRSAILLHPSLTAFYSQLLERFGENGQCEISLLRVDGVTVAGLFAFDIGDTFYALKTGYNEKYAELAPGNTLLARVIDRLHEEGNIRNVNLVTGTAWLDKWKPLHYQVFCCLVYRSSLVAALLRTHRLVSRLRSAFMSAASSLKSMVWRRYRSPTSPVVD